jgi:hypothetical protein
MEYFLLGPKPLVLLSLLGRFVARRRRVVGVEEDEYDE